MSHKWENRRIPKRRFLKRIYTDKRNVRRLWISALVIIWVSIGYFVSTLRVDPEWTPSDTVALKLSAWAAYSFFPTLGWYVLRRRLYYKKFYFFSDYLAAFKLTSEGIIYDLYWVSNMPFLAEEFDKHHAEFSSDLIDFTPSKYEVRLQHNFGKQNIPAYFVLEVEALGSVAALQQFVNHLPLVCLETCCIAKLVGDRATAILDAHFRSFQFDPRTQAAERMENTMQNRLDAKLVLLGYRVLSAKIEPLRALARAL